MANPEGTEPDQSRKGTPKRVRSKGSMVDANPPPSRPSPIDRLESARVKHIELLDEERRRLLKKVDELQAVVDRLGPENARLKEALGNAVANNVLATILVAIGGGSISFATFVEGASKVVAYLGVAVLVSGVLVLISPVLRSRVGHP